MSNEALLALAEMAGISPTWIDAFGSPQTVSHEEFKRRSATARAVVRTGECTPYANIMLIAGVAFG